MKKRICSLVVGVLMICSMLSTTVFADSKVAKVGNTEYETINEALANWSANTTLTLQADITLSDVVQLKSTEHHILDLGTYTLTAASGKNAFEIIAHGTGSSERTALTIKADATNPGSINADSKAIVYYDYSKGKTTENDRPIIKVEGGIFNGSTASFGTAGFFAKGTAARKCVTFNIIGGTFNCSIIGTGKSKMLISGGTFNYSVGSQGDSTCYRLISGGKFKSFGFMTADASNKFSVGSALSTFDCGCYVDEEDYLVVGGAVITEPGSYEASTAGSVWNSALKYSSVAANPLFWEDAYAALKKASNKEVTIYTSELDLKDFNFKGTMLMPTKDSTLKVFINEGATPSWKVGTKLENHIALYTRNVNGGVEERTYFLVPIVVNDKNGGSVAAVNPAEQNVGAAAANAKSGYYFDYWKVDTAAGTSNETVETIVVDPAAIPALITANFAAKTPEAVPAATFTAPDRIEGLEAGAAYMIDETELFADAEGVISVNPDWYGKSLSIIKKARDYKYLDSDAQPLVIPPRFSLTYVDNEGEQSGYVLEGETAFAYNGTPARIGYGFGGWFTSADDGVTLADEAYDFDAAITEDITLYAKWVPNAYKVKYDANGGEGAMEAQNFTYDENQALAVNAFTKTNMNFNGWNTEADGSGTAYADGDSVGNLSAEKDAEVLLYAQWTAKPAQTIAFDTTDRIAIYGDDVLDARVATAEGAITYFSSDETIAKVDANGVVTVLKAGEVFITAAAAETEIYASGSAFYTLKIAKAEVKITANNAEIFAGEKVPAFTYKVEGLIGEDQLITNPTCTTDAKLDIAGTYVIVPANADAGNNYAITYVSGTLTVKPLFNIEVEEHEESKPGQVTLDKTVVSKGEVVVLEIKPEKGYQLDEIIVVDALGNKLTLTKISETKYSFIMPKNNVSVDVKFEEIQTECLKGEACVFSGYFDLNASAWYHDGVHYCIENGLMKGVAEKQFAPNNATSRAMIVTILWNLEGNPVGEGKINFEDVQTDRWYTEAIRWAASKGIIEGYGNGKFGVEDVCTREQMAVILHRYAQSKNESVTAEANAEFLDLAKVSTWAVEAIKWANANSILIGKPGKILDPKNSATRAEAAAMMQRYCQLG